MTTHPILEPGVAEGEEFKLVRDMFEVDYASQHLGIRITDVALGDVRGYMDIQDWMCNGHGTVQGGLLVTFADTLFAGACNSPGETAVAAQLSMHFLRPVFKGARVEGHAVQKQTFGKNGITDVVLSVDGKPVCEFRGTSRVVDFNR